MKESDWKIFKKIKEKALDKYCNRILKEFSNVIEKKNANAHSRYLELYKLIHDRDELLADIFNGHSRSKAGFQLLMMRREALADEALLKELSDEFYQSTDPERYNSRF